MIGCSVTMASKALPAPHWRENTGMVPATNMSSRFFSRISKRTVRSLSATTRATPASCVCTAGDAALPASRVKLCTTSAASTGLPSQKRACGCSLKLMALKSCSTCISCASSPYMAMGSSCPRWASDSTIQISTPAGAMPRVVQGLYLSKLLRRSGLRSLSVPPRGAFGLT